jgi:hypothetical protein
MDAHRGTAERIRIGDVTHGNLTERGMPEVAQTSQTHVKSHLLLCALRRDQATPVRARPCGYVAWKASAAVLHDANARAEQGARRGRYEAFAGPATALG